MTGPTLTQLPDGIEPLLIKAHLAALQSMGQTFAPLTQREAFSASFAAIHAEAMTYWGRDFHPAALRNHLTIVGIRAIHEAQAGRMGALDRAALVHRIEGLTDTEKAAYSLRYEHEMTDAQIALTMGVEEGAVVSLMLRALLKITGVGE